MNEQIVVPAWRSIVLRLVVVYVLFTSIVIVVALAYMRGYQFDRIQEEFGLERMAIAASTSPYIRAADLASIESDADVDTVEFNRVHRVLERARAQNGLSNDEVYIVRPTEKDGVYEFVAMLQENTFVGDPYNPPQEVLEAYARVLDEGLPARTRLFEDENGMFISGLAPILDDFGTPVAILHADVGVDSYVSKEAEVRRLTALAGITIVIFILLIGLFVYRTMNSKVRALLLGTKAILDEDYDHRIRLKGGDELVQISDALDLSLARLKERFEMLKFLPRHTARMIASRAQHGVDLHVASRVDVVVLESDIRGFTRLSQEMSSEEVILMLNTYVRLQAELIEREDGSIDKYMGDAVLAVFEGDRREERALRCAHAIQQEVEMRNAAPQFGQPVHVGIGIASGEVVMGNMGSEQRMEHTVIGSTVNLAARLCSAAGRREIVMTEKLARLAGLGPDEIDEKLEPLQAKGFDEPVKCVRIVFQDDEAQSASE